MSESYAGRSQADMLDVLDQEVNTPAAAVPGSRDGAALAQLLGEALAHAQGRDGTEDAAEIRAITDATMRLLLGAPLHSDGKLSA